MTLIDHSLMIVSFKIYRNFYLNINIKYFELFLGVLIYLSKLSEMHRIK